jgi:chorismate mutase/prephenate dehydratase
MIIERNDNLVKDKDMAHIFREIMSACLALEQGINVAYLGPERLYYQLMTESSCPTHQFQLLVFPIL